jgi:GntR family transcriptional regulator / MocR family aminotransferase
MPVEVASWYGHLRADWEGHLPDLPITLDRELPAPLAVQLADAVRAAAAGGTLRVGDRLPSTRDLATRLGVSRTVTAAAYEQLHAEGWLAGRHGSGTYVAATPHERGRQPRQRRQPTRGVPERLLDLTPGSSWAAGLDAAAWRRAWRASGDAAPLGRPERAGLPAYRATVAEHLLRHRGLAVTEDAVLATGGTTAALLELALGVLDGRPVAVEEPGYQRAVGTLRAAGIPVTAAPVDAHGLVPEALPEGLAAVYCTPAHQYPLGPRLPADRRVALVERARAEGFWVIEDDYDGELRYDVAPLPLLAALGPDVVVHLGTTSKIFSATLGAGWVVAPRKVTAAVLAHRERTGTAPAAAGQRLIVELARHGDLARHLRRLRRELALRRELLVGALTAAGLPVLGDDAGAHVLVPLPHAHAETAAQRAGAAAGLRLDGLARHHAGTPHRFGTPLGYATATRQQLTGALPALIDVLSAAAAFNGRRFQAES